MKLIVVGRMKSGPERELFERYWTRTTPFAKSLGFGRPECVELRESQADSAQQRKSAEAQMLLAKSDEQSALVVFDERGKTLTTPQFSDHLARWRDAGRALNCVVGGPDGLDTSIRQRADLVVSFGAMTMPHQLVRVLVAEQIYRALTVLAGHPYHRA